MHDSYQKLISDTITYVKGIKDPIFTSYGEEEPPKISSSFKISEPVAVKQTTPEAFEREPQLERVAETTSSEKPQAPTSPPSQNEKESEKELPKAITPLKRIKKSQPIHEIEIIAPKKVIRDSLEDIKKHIEAVMPSLYINFNIPSDEAAKRKKNSYLITEYMPDVPILTFQDKASAFLEEVAKAISSHFFLSKVVDLSKVEGEGILDQLIKTDHLKLIIAIDTMLFSHRTLMKYYQEFPAKKERYLGKTPLLLLPDPSLYMKDPSLKRSLWNLLCDMLLPLKK